MDTLIFDFNNSKALKEFKKELGSANQYLITILLGLDDIKTQGNNFKKPDSFSTTWSPINVETTCKRSREYVIKSSLSWVVDCLDMYFSLCHRKPTIIEDENLKKKMDKAGQHVSEKFESFYTILNCRDKDIEIYGALVALTIQWRNNTTHHFASNNVSDHYIQILHKYKDLYYKEFCALDINTMITHFNDNEVPTFKDMASIIRGTQKFIYKVDSILISSLNKQRYIKDIISNYYSDKKHLLNLIPTLTQDRLTIKFRNLIQNYSVSFSDKGTYELTLTEIKNLFYDVFKENNKRPISENG